MSYMDLNIDSKDCTYLDLYSEQHEPLLLDLTAQRHKNVFVLFGQKLGNICYPHSVSMHVLRRYLSQSLESLLQQGRDAFIFHSISFFSALCAELLEKRRQSYPDLRYFIFPIHNIYHKPLHYPDLYAPFLSGAAAKPFGLFSHEDSDPAAY